jgi:hypothetical protein
MPSEYTLGAKCGLAGEDLPYDVPLESDFADGWRFGRDVRKASPIVALTREEVASIRVEGGFPPQASGAAIHTAGGWVTV